MIATFASILPESTLVFTSSSKSKGGSFQFLSGVDNLTLEVGISTSKLLTITSDLSLGLATRLASLTVSFVNPALTALLILSLGSGPVPGLISVFSFDRNKSANETLKVT